MRIVFIFGVTVLVGFGFLLYCIGNYKPSEIRIGMKVTNGPCKGYVSEIDGFYAIVVRVECGEIQYNFIREAITHLKEVK